tara:strand:- start:780 stop:1073 length:294 start_codon:yes stop_codon:yes gene_type:complete
MFIIANILASGISFSVHNFPIQNADPWRLVIVSSKLVSFTIVFPAYILEPMYNALIATPYNPGPLVPPPAATGPSPIRNIIPSENKPAPCSAPANEL